MNESQAARLISLLLTQANVAGKLPVAWKIAQDTYEDWPPETERPDRYHGYTNHHRNEITFVGDDGKETFRIIVVKVAKSESI